MFALNDKAVFCSIRSRIGPPYTVYSAPRFVSEVFESSVMQREGKIVTEINQAINL